MKRRFQRASDAIRFGALRALHSLAVRHRWAGIEIVARHRLEAMR